MLLSPAFVSTPAVPRGMDAASARRGEAFADRWEFPRSRRPNIDPQEVYKDIHTKDPPRFLETAIKIL